MKHKRESANSADKNAVFKALCDYTQNWYGIDIITSAELEMRTGLSRYKIIQALHLLREDGLVSRGSRGCPAQYSYGEITEMICDAAPPVNGWKLTKKGYDTDVYKAAKKEFLKGLEEWANSRDDEEEKIDE